MSTRICIVDWCDKSTRFKTGCEYCEVHYRELLRKGRVLQRDEKRVRYNHGFSKTHPLYAVWTNMRQRCNDPRNPRYPDYGGRGISVCERWDNFANFVADMGDRPEGRTANNRPLYSLDRIDNDGNYEPTNCRWALSEQQNENKRQRKDARIKEKS